MTRGRVAAGKGQGLLMPVGYPGPRTGMDRNGYVYLPADYFRPSALRYPAVELFHGYPAGPPTWNKEMHLAHLLDVEIAARRIPPLVAVIPRLYEHNDGECMDAVRGQANESYPAVDVVDDVVNTFRVLNSRSWAALGYSTGGFCAVNIGFHSPQRFAAVASLSGYFTAVSRTGGPETCTAAVAVAATATPRSGGWSTRTLPVPRCTCSPRRATARLSSRTPDGSGHPPHAPGLPMETVSDAGGGHNFDVWGAALAPALGLGGSSFPGPLAGSPGSTQADRRRPRAGPRRPRRPGSARGRQGWHRVHRPPEYRAPEYRPPEYRPDSGPRTLSTLATSESRYIVECIVTKSFSRRSGEAVVQQLKRCPGPCGCGLERNGRAGADIVAGSAAVALRPARDVAGCPRLRCRDRGQGNHHGEGFPGPFGPGHEFVSQPGAVGGAAGEDGLARAVGQGRCSAPARAAPGCAAATCARRCWRCWPSSRCTATR